MSARRRRRKSQAQSFDLTANPFYILGVSPDATAEQIALAYETGLADHYWPEDLVHRAQQTLMAPRPRLEAELSWLPGLSAEQAERTMELLLGPARDRGAIYNTPAGLDRANILADLCYHGGKHDRQMHAGLLIGEYRSIDEDRVFDTVARNRAAAAFAEVDRSMLREVLRDLRRRHAKAVFDALGAQSDADDLFHGLGGRFPSAGRERFIIADVVNDYLASIEPRIAKLKGGAMAAIDQLRKDPDASSAYEELRHYMVHWQDQMLWAQKYEGTKGQDEPRSTEIYRALRSLYTDIFKEGSRPDLALKLATVAQKRLNFLPGASYEIAKAVREMSEHISVAQRELEQLNAAAVRARSDRSWLRSQLIHFSRPRRLSDPADALSVRFDAAAKATIRTAHEGKPWQILLDLAEALLREHGEPLAARDLCRCLQAHPQMKPYAVTKRLETLADEIENALLEASLQKAIGAGKSSLDVKLAANRILARNPNDSRRDELLRLKAQMNRRILRDILGVVGMIAGLCLVVATMDHCQRKAGPVGQRALPAAQAHPFAAEQLPLRQGAS